MLMMTTTIRGGGKQNPSGFVTLFPMLARMAVSLTKIWRYVFCDKIFRRDFVDVTRHVGVVTEKWAENVTRKNNNTQIRPHARTICFVVKIYVTQKLSEERRNKEKEKITF